MAIKKRFTDDSFKKEPWFRALSSALLSCKTEDDMANFLRDIATLSELQAMSERLEVAKQLSKGLSYRQVAKNTGASTTTVTRVAKFIENGEGGYRKFLNVHRHHRMQAQSVSDSNRQELIEKAKEQALGQSLNESSPPQAHAEKPPVSILQKYLR